MAVVIGELLVNLRASTAAFAKDLDKVTQLSFNSAKSIERSWNIIGAAAGAAVTAAVTAIAVGIDKTVEWEVHMLHLAQAAGTTTETMSGLSFAAKMMGLDIDQVARAMERFDKQIAAAGAGNQKAQQNMSILGIDVSTLKTSDEALMKLADHIAGMGDGLAKTAVAAAAFGVKLGPAMIPLMEQGSKGIQDFLDQAKAMGVIITRDQAEAAEKFEQNMTRMKEALHGLWVEITNATIPAVNSLLAKFADDKKTDGFIKSIGRLAVAMGGVGSMAGYLGEGSAIVAGQEKQRKAVDAMTLAVSDGQKAIDALKKSTEGLITSLRTQIATIGMNAEQVQVYKIRTDAAKLGISAWGEAEVTLYEKLQRKLNLLQQFAVLDNSKLDTEKRNFLADKLAAETSDLKIMEQQLDVMMRMQAIPQLTNMVSGGQSDAFITANQQLTTELEHSIAVWGMSAREVTLYNLSLIDSSASAVAAAQKTADLQDRLAHMQQVTAAWKEFGQVADQALNDLIFSGKKFTQVLADVTKMLGEMFLKWALFGFGDKSASGGGGGLFGALFSGLKGLMGFASGGSVAGGQPIMVGEQGPEMFVPAMSGRIIPNGAIGGGVHITYQIDARGSSITEEQFVRSLQATENRAVQRAVGAGREAQLRT